MRRLMLVVLALMALGGTAQAQDFIRYYPPPGVFSVGTAALPSITFAGDPDTGLYWESANRFKLVAGTTPALDLTNGATIVPQTLRLANIAGTELQGLGDTNDSQFAFDSSLVINVDADGDGVGTSTFSIQANSATIFMFHDFGVFQLGADAAAVVTQQIKAADGLGTDKPGGTLLLTGGQSTGTGNGGSVQLQTTYPTTTGATNTAQTDRLIVRGGAKTLTESAATSVERIALPAESGVSGELLYQIFATDGSTPQVRSGRVIFSVTNDGGTEVCVLGTPEETDNTPTGTLTVTVACDTAPANAVDVTLNAVSSLAQTTLTASYQLLLNGSIGAITSAAQ